MAGKNNTKALTLSAIFLAIILTVQFFKFYQPITGTVVNCILLIAAYKTSVKWGVLIGLISPFMAVFMSVVPPIMLTASIFIAAGNALYIYLFNKIYNRSKMLITLAALLVAAFSKFLLLYFASTKILTLPEPVTIMLGFPQLLTAVLGGLIALFIIRALEHSSILDK